MAPHRLLLLTVQTSALLHSQTPALRRTVRRATEEESPSLARELVNIDMSGPGHTPCPAPSGVESAAWGAAPREEDLQGALQLLDRADRLDPER